GGSLGGGSAPRVGVLRSATRTRPAAVNPGRSAAPPALLEDAVERLARARLGEVVEEQDKAGDRQQDRGGDKQGPIHGGGSLSRQLVCGLAVEHCTCRKRRQLRGCRKRHGARLGGPWAAPTSPSSGPCWWPRSFTPAGTRRPRAWRTGWPRWCC